MPTVTLAPDGEVFTFVHSGSDIPVTGSAPQWSDESDLTYATIANENTGVGGGFIQISAYAYLNLYDFPQAPTAVQYHVRASSDSLNSGPIQVSLDSDDLSVFMAGEDEILQVQPNLWDGEWFVSPVRFIRDPDAFATACHLQTLKIRASQTVEGAVNTALQNRSSIYEAFIVVTYGAMPPSLRQFPGGARAGATRKYPPNSNQHSLRRVGGTY